MRVTKYFRVAVQLNPLLPFVVHTAGKDLPPLPTVAEVDKETLLKNFETLHRIRRVEMLSDKAYKEKKIRGFCHLYTGQEAIAVGMENVLTFDDAVVTAYRDHGWFMVRGGSASEVFAEMFGKQMGCSKGKGGSMHMYHTKNNFYGGNGIVGAQVPIGAGLAWKHSYTNGVDSPKNIAVTLYGDGAANQGQIFEAMNMAALWHAPCLFVCENNHFGMGTSVERASYDRKFYARGHYIPGIKIDGMDLLAIQEGTRWAKDYLLKGNGPLVVEFDTYRYVGHSMSDPGTTYRTASDVESVRKERDCINKLHGLILHLGFATEPELSSARRKVFEEVDQALTEAKKAPDTNMAELYSDIFSGEQFPVRTCQGTKFVVPAAK